MTNRLNLSARIRVPVRAAVALAAMAGLNLGCANSPTGVMQTTRETWVVVDVTEGREIPIENAGVLFNYVGSTSLIVDSSSSCTGAAYARTDSQGRFVIPHGAILQGVYKTGFVYANPRKYKYSEYKVPLRKSASRAETLAQFQWVMFEGVCKSADNRGGAIADYVSVALPDIRAFASDSDSRLVLQQIESIYEERKGDRR